MADSGLDAGRLVAYVGTSPAMVAKAEIARQWADLLTEALHYDMPLDNPELRERELRALDLETLQEAVRRHIRPEELRVTVGLPVD